MRQDRDTSGDGVHAAERDGTPHKEEEETDPTPIKEEQTTPVRIPDPPTIMTAVALHKGSASTVNDALQLFDLPPIDTSMTAARMLEFTPISQGINLMEFVVLGVDAFINLSRSYFTMKF